MPEVRLAVQVYQLASKYQVEALMVLCSKVGVFFSFLWLCLVGLVDGKDSDIDE